MAKQLAERKKKKQEEKRQQQKSSEEQKRKMKVHNVFTFTLFGLLI